MQPVKSQDEGVFKPFGGNPGSTTASAHSNCADVVGWQTCVKQPALCSGTGWYIK